jgi:hypothetical protein
MRVFLIKVDSIGKAVGVIERVGRMDFGVLVLFDCLDDSGQF